MEKNIDEYLIKKRKKVLKKIKPICEAFNIKEYDYLINDNKEFLAIYETKIGCSGNSVNAIVQELVGYLFIKHWHKRSLGHFDTQTRNVIKEYWNE